MNVKTTLILAIMALGVATAVYLAMKEDLGGEKTPVTKTEEASRRVFEEGELDGVDRIELIRGGDRETLVFVADDSGDGWEMVEPMQAPADRYEVQTALLSTVESLEYSKEYGADAADRPSADFAGLEEDDPATAKVKLFKDGKLLAELLVGKSLPTGKGSYVEVAGSDVIYESARDLTETFTKPLKKYRSKTLVKVDVADVQKLIVSGARNYTLSRSDGGWMIEKPTRGRADDTKAQTVVRALANLTVQDFKMDNPASLAMFGLDNPLLTVTIEMKPEKPESEGEDAETQPAAEEQKPQTHTLLIGGPIDPEGSGYFATLKVAPWVFSISKYTFNNLSTPLDDLRNKSLADVNPSRVTEIAVKSGDSLLELSKEDGQWQFADGSAADAVAANDLIKAVDDLKATDFVEEGQTLVELDWLSPRASITLTEEGEPNPVTVLIGPATATRKMVYVRNAAEEVTALVRSEEVEPLLATPASFRDRLIVEFERERLKKLSIDRKDGINVTLERTGEGMAWKMVEPVEAEVATETVRNIEQTLAKLQAERIVGSGDRARYGLDNPDVTVSAYFLPLSAAVDSKPAAEDKPETADIAKPGDGENTPADTQPATDVAKAKKRVQQLEELLEYQESLPLESDGSGRPVQNPKATKMLKEQLAAARAAAGMPTTSTAPAEEVPTTGPASEGPAYVVHRLYLSKQGERVYACLDDGDLIYEVGMTFYEDLTSELHKRQIASFEVDDVTTLALGSGAGRLVFRKSGDEWTYLAEPGLPIDGEKIKEVLNDVRDLSTHRYVSYDAGDLSQYGLGDDARTVEVGLKGGKTVTLRLSAQGPSGDTEESRYATLAGSGKVFLLKGEQTSKLDRELEDFEKQP